MKKVLLFIALIANALSLNAQAPQSINYQAVARNTNGMPITGTTVNVGFNIREGSANGSIIYSESHTNVSTGTTGLFTLSIGQGQASVGTFSSIPWATGTKFLELLINGASAGTQQMVSVPYALYAEKTSNSTDKIAIIEYKVNGNGSNPGSGQTTNAGQWNKRLLNSETANNIPSSLSFNNANDVLVFQPGKYLVRAYGAANYCDGNVLRIRNTLTNVDEIYGTPGFSKSDEIDGENSYSFLEGILTVTAINSQYVLEHWIQSNPPSGGSAIGKLFGDFPNLPTGFLCAWSRIVIQKIE